MRGINVKPLRYKRRPEVGGAATTTGGNSVAPMPNSAQVSLAQLEAIASTTGNTASHCGFKMENTGRHRVHRRRPEAGGTAIAEQCFRAARGAVGLRKRGPRPQAETADGETVGHLCLVCTGRAETTIPPAWSPRALRN